MHATGAQGNGRSGDLGTSVGAGSAGGRSIGGLLVGLVGRFGFGSGGGVGIVTGLTSGKSVGGLLTTDGFGTSRGAGGIRDGAGVGAVSRPGIRAFNCAWYFVASAASRCRNRSM